MIPRIRAQTINGRVRAGDFRPWDTVARTRGDGRRRCSIAQEAVMSRGTTAIALLLVSIVLPAAATAQGLTFRRADQPSTIGARGVASADFDGDGWLDVAQANTGSNTVTVLLNHHDDRLVRAFDIAVGAGPFDITTADFNRDGIADLAVADADGAAISILIGRGDGRFTRSDIATGTSRGPRGITAGDVDGDGTADLVYSAFDGGTLTVLHGDGRGAFATSAALPAPSQPQGVAIADVDRDGHADIAVATVASGLMIWSWHAGGYTARTITGEPHLNVLAVGDLNSDGWPDVAAASTDRGRVAIYLGGRSGLVYARSYTVDADPRGIAIADLDLDGAPDVITASRGTSTINVLAADPAHRGSFLPRLAIAAGHGSRAVVAADFNHDGLVDLVTGNQYSANASALTNVTHFLRAGYSFGRLVLPAGAALANSRGALSAGRGFAAADFNRDGLTDFAQHVDGADSVAVILNGGTTVTLAGPAPYSGHVIDDFNGDGNPDVMYFASPDASDDTTIVTFLGNGQGAFTTSPVTHAPAMPLAACTAGDMNRDGRRDLVCTERGEVDSINGALHVLIGNGNGTFRLSPAVAGATGVDPQLADLNGDGRLDVVLAGTGQVWFGDGAGGLIRGTGLPEGFNPGWRIAVVDLNHDRYPDLVTSFNGEALTVWLGGASGYEPTNQNVFDCECSFSFVLADIDIDGNLDVLVDVSGGDFSHVMFVERGNGDGTFVSRFEGGNAFALAPGEIVVADVNRDGLPDVAVPDGRGIDVLLNQRNETNHLPVVVSRDLAFTLDYRDLIDNHFGCITFPLDIPSDPDQHAVAVSWDVRGPEFAQPFAMPNGFIGGQTEAIACFNSPGTYEVFLVASDDRGATVSRRLAVVTITGPKEIVLYMKDAGAFGDWQHVNDASAAAGVRAYDPNHGAPKVNAPVGTDSVLTLQFIADPALAYKLWIRLKADGNYWGNDSVWVQFAWSSDAAGHPAYQWGTSSGLAVNLEECAGCGESGWGWEDDGWGAINRNGVLVRFPKGGLSQLLIQRREDGVSIDQVVLSAEKYLTTRPGAAKNDHTILTATPP
jgi:hypothetical protein